MGVRVHTPWVMPGTFVSDPALSAAPWAWKDLAMLLPFEDMSGLSLTGRFHATFSGVTSLTTSTDRAGRALSGFSDTPAAYAYVADNPDTNRDFTIMVVAKIVDNSAFQLLADNGSGTSGGFQYFLDNTTGNIRFRVDDSGANGAAVDGPSAVLDEPATYVLRLNKSGLAEVAANGVFGGSTIDVSAYGDTSGSRGQLQLGLRDGARWPMTTSNIHAALLWYRALSDQEVAQLAVDPFAPFRPRRKVWRVPAAGGGTTQAIGLATSSATGEQLTAIKGYRWRNDDGSESAATWAAAENTAHTISNGAHARLRFLVRAPLAGQYQLEVAEVGTENWSKVQVE